MAGIEWTDQTWNVMTGCTKVSPGCDHCYMYREYPRLRAMGVPGYAETPDRVTLIRERLEQPLRWQRPRMVFVNSMSDIFHPAADHGFLLEVFGVMFQAAEERGHIFQLLTKRPGRAVGFWEACRENLGRRVAPERVDGDLRGVAEIRPKAHGAEPAPGAGEILLRGAAP